MGCVESKERPSDVHEDTGQSPRATTPPPPPPPEKEEEKRIKKKKIKIRKKLDGQKKEVEAEKPGLISESESAKVTVIWQRWSFFSSNHETYNKHLEGEAAGPSGRLAQASQISNLSAEDVVRPLDRTVS